MGVKPAILNVAARWAVPTMSQKAVVIQVPRYYSSVEYQFLFGTYMQVNILCLVLGTDL